MFYFSSDVHFNDNNTLINDNRPFVSAKKFDKYVIRLWNKQVRKEDVIYFVGDFVDCDGEGHDSWKKSILYVKKIKAKVILVIGNNEERVIKHYFDNNFEKFRNYCVDAGFDDVYKDLDVEFNNRKFHLTHKAINYKKGVINLFGHSHRACGLYKPFGFNIGCDLNHFKLYSEKDIEFMIEMKKKYWDKDRNLNMKYEG